MWKDLSMSQRAEVIQLAIKNGMRDLNQIRSFYDDTVGNEFAKGGDISDEQYYATMEKVAEENNPIWNKQRIAEGGRPLSVEEDLIRILNDNSYDYRGFYNKYPPTAANANSHWTDEFKTAYHPTFSDQSKYSGKKSQYNPYGYRGGHWVEETFFPEIWQTANSNKFPDGGPLVEAANYYPDGGPEETYNVGYIPEVTIEAERKNNHYIYYDPWSGRYKGIGIGGKRIEYGEGFNPEGSILLPDALAYENQRLERAKQDDLNHTQAFAENIKDFVGGLVTAPMFDVAAEPIGTVISKLASKAIKPKVTAKNAASITDAQWDAAYNAAVKARNIKEAQRLRDLHFKTKASSPVLSEEGLPLKTYHTVSDAYDYNFNEFNPYIEGEHSGIFTTDNPIMSGSYARKIVSKEEQDAIIEAIRQRELKNGNNKYNNFRWARKQILKEHPFLNNIKFGRQKNLYINMDNPAIIEGENKAWSRIPYENVPEDLKKYPIVEQRTNNGPVTSTRRVDKILGGYTNNYIDNLPEISYDGAIFKDIWDYGPNKFVSPEFNKAATVFDIQSPNNLKLADAISYDDVGNIIPLSKRDNFNVNDIRYSWLPWFLGGGTTAVLTGVDTKATGGFLTKKSRNKVKKH